MDFIEIILNYYKISTKRLNNMENRLYIVRKYLKLKSRRALAEVLNIKENKIRDVELGNQKISIDIAEKLENTYNINPWWLLTGKGDMLKETPNEVEKANELPSVNITMNHNQEVKIEISGKIQIFRK